MVPRYWSLFVAAAMSAIVVHPVLAVPQTKTPVTQTSAPWPPAGVERAGKTVRHPVVVKEFKPEYTKEAMNLGIQGTLEVEAVINTDGTVGEVRVVRSLDKEHGLDEQAIKAVKQWEFKPAVKDGVAVPVLVTIELSFALRR